MKHSVLTAVRSFLDRYLDPSAPILLGLSGGPDSMALFYALLELIPHQLHVAHVDHAARPESCVESERLRSLVEGEGVDFYRTRLLEVPPGECAEEWWREQRLAFFSELCSSHGCQAVVLGHHANDQAETVLKRVLEGANLTALAGIRPLRSWKGLTLARPLLGLKKRDLEDFLQAKGAWYLEDPTNHDPSLLRGRMRSKILPGLAGEFGKNIVGPLAELGEEAAELQAYLKEKTASLWPRVHTSSFGIWVDLKGKHNRFELKSFLRELLRQHGMQTSRVVLNQLSGLVTQGTANREVSISGRRVYVDRGQVFFLPVRSTEATLGFELAEGEFIWGPWRLTVSRTDVEESSAGWKDLFTDHLSVTLPAGTYRLGLADCSRRYHSKRSLDRWWSEQKVPAFLRQELPVVCRDDEVVHEFLSGRRFLTGAPAWHLHCELDVSDSGERSQAAALQGRDAGSSITE